jgi:F-type H+-transporting ATPase subunit epsilon
MHLEILTPVASLFNGEVISVKVPGAKGSFEILSQHAPIISSLDTKGEIKVVTASNETVAFPCKGGVVEVLNNTISILTEA